MKNDFSSPASASAFLALSDFLKDDILEKKNLGKKFSYELEEDEFGLVAYGGQLSSALLIEAYFFGIFPWYEEEPIKWFSPPQRMIFNLINLSDFKVSKSFKKFLKTNSYQISFDTCFPEVTQLCRTVKRKGETGTWITKAMLKAYTDLFNLGVAHSVEVKRANELVGGLYGISLGKAFFGESMFSLESNTSKLALYSLQKILKRWDFHFIDCQVENPHLKSLGAKTISKKDFITRLKKSNTFRTKRVNWAELV